jgi:glycine/D-amino acid oxidase-like deaminating enzyme
MPFTALTNPRDLPLDTPSAKPRIGRSVSCSYWQRIGIMPVMPVRDDTAELPARASVVIIGGGFAGLATALRIKELDADADVVLIEAKSIGYGASGRNGGLMSPLPAPVWLTTALHDKGHARAMGLLNRKVTAAAEWANEIAPHAEIVATDMALEAKGTITDACLAHISGTLHAAGIDHRFAAGDTQGGPRALKLEAHTVNPYQLVRGLAHAARKRGVAIVENAPVHAVAERDEGDALITLTDGRAIIAGTVVLSTNAYTASLSLPDAPRAKVVHNYMLATAHLAPETLDRLQAAGATSGRFIVELNKAYVFYRVHQGRLVFGGIEKLKSSEGGDLDVPVAVMAGLKKHLAQTLGDAPLPEIAEAWGGRFHMTSTDLPIIRRAGTKSAIVHNVGYGGTGVALTLSLAPVAAALALRRPIADRELAEIYNTMRNTSLPVVGAMRFAADVIATWIAERWARH